MVVVMVVVELRRRGYTEGYTRSWGIGIESAPLTLDPPVVASG